MRPVLLQAAFIDEFNNDFDSKFILIVAEYLYRPSFF